MFIRIIRKETIEILVTLYKYILCWLADYSLLSSDIRSPDQWSVAELGSKLYIAPALTVLRNNSDFLTCELEIRKNLWTLVLKGLLPNGTVVISYFIA